MATNPIRSDDLITVDAAAAVVDVSRPTMRLYIAEQRVRSIRIGTRLFASRSDCERLRDGRATSKAAKLELQQA